MGVTKERKTIGARYDELVKLIRTGLPDGGTAIEVDTTPVGELRCGTGVARWLVANGHAAPTDLALIAFMSLWAQGLIAPAPGETHLDALHTFVETTAQMMLGAAHGFLDAPDTPEGWEYEDDTTPVAV